MFIHDLIRQGAPDAMAIIDHQRRFTYKDFQDAVDACRNRLYAAGVRQGDLLVIAGDLDGRACDASYVQLSLLGYPAIVQHMDALTQRRISPDRYTPGYFLHCLPMRGAAA